VSALLAVDGLEAGYGASRVLFGIVLEVRAGEVVTLLGRNGMGKSTTIKSIVGMVKPARGAIRFAGRDVAGQPSYKIAQAGIGLVPEQRQIFPNLTVRENLIATARSGAPSVSGTPWTLARVYGLFPRLQERAHQLGGTLSGGEQQMLAIGRALMTNPRLLILDEATEGLAPLIRRDIMSCLEQLRATGLAMIVIDKHVGPLLHLATRHYIVEKGRVAWHGSSDELRAQPELLRRYLGV
jgi:branched-chain amino acid transport system ATP-binding protein